MQLFPKWERKLTVGAWVDKRVLGERSCSMRGSFSKLRRIVMRFCKSLPKRVGCTLAVGAVFLFVAVARAEPAMWMIHDADSTIYLIGTAHLLRHEAKWRSPKLEKALSASSELWLEVPDPDNEAAALPLIQQY
jgi:uncharacterized protein YbaP (TraB family)